MKRAEVRARVDRSVGEHHIARSLGFITADDVESVVAAARRTSLRLFDGRARRLRHMDRSGGRGWQRRLGGQLRAAARSDAGTPSACSASGAVPRAGAVLAFAAPKCCGAMSFRSSAPRQAEGPAPRGRCSRLRPRRFDVRCRRGPRLDFDAALATPLDRLRNDPANIFDRGLGALDGGSPVGERRRGPADRRQAARSANALSASSAGARGRRRAPPPILRVGNSVAPAAIASISAASSALGAVPPPASRRRARARFRL